MKDIWNAIKSIFVNDAHSIISKRGKEILAEQQKEYTFVPNTKTTRTQSDMTDTVIGVNGKRRRVETDYNKIFNNQREIKRKMKQTAVDWLVNEIKFARNLCDDPSAEMDIWHTLDVLIAKGEEAKEMEKVQIMRAARLCHFEGTRQSAKSGQGYADYAEQYYNDTTTKPLTNLEITDRRLGLFLNWLIKHYNTASNSLMSYYTNAMNEEVSIAEILEHYNKEK
jgi:hypothetical protein